MSGNASRLPGPPARAAALTLIVFVLAACGANTLPPASSVTSPLVGQSAAGSASLHPAASGTSPGTLEEPATVLEHGVIVGSQVPLYVTTDGERIVFSGGPPRQLDPLHGPNLYEVRPNGEPVLLFDNPRADSDLLPIAVGGGYVAFGETNLAAFGDRAWILWLLPPGASEPIELDRNPPLTVTPFPLVAVNDRHVVWQHVTLGPGEPHAELIDLSLPDLTRRVLRADDPTRYQWWDPALDGERLIYTEVDYVHGDPESDFKPAELYTMLVDLRDADPRPERLDTSGMAAEPAIHGSTVVWKEAEDVFSWGALTVHSLDTGVTTSVATTPQSGIRTPSVGNRFVAFWGLDATEFYLYDLKAGAVARVYEVEDTALAGAAYRAEVAGDLLVWAQSTESGGSVIAWARLPTMDDP